MGITGSRQYEAPGQASNPEWGHKGMIHWDIDTSELPPLNGADIAATWRPDPATHIGVQGVVYLRDTAVDQGGFQCIPGFHRTFYEWVKTQPADRNPRFPDMTGLDVKVVDGKAGDLVIWHRLLAHGNGHNRSTGPRAGPVHHHVAGPRGRRNGAHGARPLVAGVPPHAQMAG